MGKECFEITNSHLILIKKPIKVWSDILYTIALEHSKNMALNKVPFGHQGFKNWARIIMKTYSSAWENVAYHSETD